MTLVIGIDDAGRGPIIGPMVLAGVIAKEERLEDIKKIGAKDSKLLTAKQREILAEKLKKEFEYHFEITTPQEIDENLSGTKVNLNTLEAIKTAMIINKLSESRKEKIKVIVDCPSTNISAWTNTLKKFVEKKEIEIRCEHKADFNHAIVGAASIIAKTTRDAEIEKIKKAFGIDFGSGYPSDPITCDFLKENAEKYKDEGIFRKTWQTWKNLCDKKKQKSIADF